MKRGENEMANRKRNKQIAVRVTDEEYAEIMKQVEKSGMTQQDFFLKAIRETNITNLDGLKEVVPEMKRIGNNLNQVAKKLNEGEGGTITQSQWDELIGGFNETWQSLKQLIRKQA